MAETWNVEHLLEDQTPDDLIASIKKKVESFKEYRKELSEFDTSKMLEALKLKEDIEVLYSRLGAYYALKLSAKTNDSEMLSRMTFMKQLGTDMTNDMMFFSLWFIDLPDKDAEKYLEAEALKDYRYYLYQKRKSRKYMKSEEVEQILSLKSITGGDAFNSLYEIMTGEFKFDFNGQEGLTQEEVSMHYRDSDPALRQEAYETILKKYEDNNTVLSEIYKNVILDWINEGIKIRGYESSISIRNFYNDIPDEVVQTMLKVIRKNVEVFTEYFKLKHELISKGEYEFSRYHVYAPYQRGEGKKYNYEESKEIVLDTFDKLDPRFKEAAKEIFDKDHVHSHPMPNKRSGAFCYSIHNEETPYILLNHTNTIRDLFTMMHEFGHGVHGVMAKKQVNLLYNTSTPVAETASVFAEMLLSSKMLDEAERKDKISLLIYLLDNQYGTIMRQAYFTVFEQEAHDLITSGATKEELQECYMETLKEQFGDMEIPEIFKNEFNYVGHFYFAPFYCYSYAWGNLSVLALYKMYLEDSNDFVDKYVNLLSQGGGKSPEDLLEDMGIDPAKEDFWQKGFDIIKEEVEELKSLV